MADPIFSLFCPPGTHPQSKLHGFSPQRNVHFTSTAKLAHTSLWTLRLLDTIPQPFKNWVSAFLMLKNRYRPLLFYYLHSLHCCVAVCPAQTPRDNEQNTTKVLQCLESFPDISYFGYNSCDQLWRWYLITVLCTPKTQKIFHPNFAGAKLKSGYSK